MLLVAVATAFAVGDYRPSTQVVCRHPRCRHDAARILAQPCSQNKSVYVERADVALAALMRNQLGVDVARSIRN